jgi:hypothetical protein
LPPLSAINGQSLQNVLALALASIWGVRIPARFVNRVTAISKELGRSHNPTFFVKEGVAGLARTIRRRSWSSW